MNSQVDQEQILKNLEQILKSDIDFLTRVSLNPTQELSSDGLIKIYRLEKMVRGEHPIDELVSSLNFDKTGMTEILKINRKRSDIDIFSGDIRKQRDSNADLRIIFANVKETKSDVNLSHIEGINELVLPSVVRGDLFLPYVTILTDKLVLPQRVYGTVYFNHLREIQEDAALPESVGGLDFLSLDHLRRWYSLPEDINDLYLPEVFKIQNGFCFPRKVSRHFSLNRMRSLRRGYSLPKEVGGNAYFNRVCNIQAGVDLPDPIGGDLSLPYLLSLIPGNSLPDEIGGKLIFRNLREIKGVDLPRNVGKICSEKDFHPDVVSYICDFYSKIDRKVEIGTEMIDDTKYNVISVDSPIESE